MYPIWPIHRCIHIYKTYKQKPSKLCYTMSKWVPNEKGRIQESYFRAHWISFHSRVWCKTWFEACCANEDDSMPRFRQLIKLLKVSWPSGADYHIVLIRSCSLHNSQSQPWEPASIWSIKILDTSPTEWAGWKGPHVLQHRIIDFWRFFLGFSHFSLMCIVLVLSLLLYMFVFVIFFAYAVQ